MKVHVISDMEGVSGIVRGPLAGDSGTRRSRAPAPPRTAGRTSLSGAVQVALSPPAPHDQRRARNSRLPDSGERE